MKEPELQPSDIERAPLPQAVQATPSVKQNPVQLDNSQNDGFPGEGEQEEELLDFEAQGTRGVDPLQVPGCAQ
eukprot:1106289-Karenia_brevis.AAC.1